MDSDGLEQEAYQCCTCGPARATRHARFQSLMKEMRCRWCVVLLTAEDGVPRKKMEKKTRR